MGSRKASKLRSKHMKFTKNMKPDELQDHIFATYANLRIGVAIIAIVFPLLLWAGELMGSEPF